MSKLPISVCMISGPEAHRIRRTLASVADWSSEIIVVLNHDDCDGTDEIAEKFEAKVVREPRKGHICPQNSVAAEATQAWIVGLDSDEVVSAELRAEIQHTQVATFSFPRLAHCCRCWILNGDWYPDRQTPRGQRGFAARGGIGPQDKLEVRGNVGLMLIGLARSTAETKDRLIAKVIAFATATRCAKLREIKQSPPREW